MNYNTASQKTRSEKITLVTIESVEQVRLFIANASDWDRVTDYFVIGVKEDGVSIATWSYTPTTKTLKIIGGTDPKGRKISLTYRHFYSNAPINLPYDLATGDVVEWEGRVNSIGSIGQQLDDENTGIVLESSSSVDLINSDGFFDSFFDTHIWENQSIKFYSWFPDIPISERAQLFEGVIESKSFSDSRISFKVKDFVFKLKNQVALNNFTLADGTVLPSLLYTPKRRIYGQVDGLKCVSLDAILDGYQITGTVTISSASLLITGVSTTFLNDVSPGDEVFIFDSNGLKYKFGVDTVDSDTQLTLGKLPDNSFAAVDIYVKPAISNRNKNRTWHIANHKLRQAEAEILSVINSRTFEVDSVLDMMPGDEVSINNITSVISRISGSTIVTATNINPIPVMTDVIVKNPIKKVYAGTRELFLGVHYLQVNTTEAKIALYANAERDLADEFTLDGNLTFTNGSRIVTTSVDLRASIKTRDWIRSKDAGRVTWYEVLSVDETQITLREPIAYSGGPYTEAGLGKNIIPIDENTLFTVNCLGMEVAGVWMKTASDAVRHLVLNDALFATVNETRFAKAKSDCDYIISMAIPTNLGQKSPLIRDVITQINNSVFGSLYGDSSQNISYSILNSTKPEVINAIKDDDIISFSVETTQKIANKVIIKYRPYTDRFSEQDTFLTYEYESTFVDDLIGIKNTIERTIYLYDTAKATIMGQRIALFNSLSSSSVKIQAKLNLAQTVVNDKIYLNLDRLYSRYGGLDKRKLGTVTGVKRDGYSTDISVSDLGNIYNRVGSISPNTVLDYASSDADDKIKHAYIVDNDTLTPDVTSEEGLGNFIIG